MEVDLTAFHFLRPLWLWLLVPALALPLAWHRRNDVRARWSRIIAPALLEHLIVGKHIRRSLLPVHTVALLIGLGAIAAAGPTWQQERPPFTQDKAPLVVVLEVARSMDAADIAPSRLERAKQKVLDLAAARKGAHTGLVVFAASAHLVVPPTDDPSMLELYLPALSPDVMPRDGKNMAAGLDAAERLLADDPTPGTIVFMSDGFDEATRSAFAQKAKASHHQLLWLAVGTEDGGPIRGPDGALATDADGRPLMATFDKNGIRALARAADVPLASMRADDDDIVWVEHRAQAWLTDDAKRTPRWEESGYWLVVPLLLLALYGFRRGWTVKWLPVLLVALTFGTAPRVADAAPWQWQNLFATPDQQGRWYFEHGDYKRAAEHFDDAMWKARAQYLAGDYTGTLATLARVKSAQACFYAGNALAHLDDYAGAAKAYDDALALQPGWREAFANRQLMTKLLAQPKQPREQGSDEEGDSADEHEPKQKGQPAQGRLVVAPSEEGWRRNLNTSPATFLRQRFDQESGAR